LRNSVRVGEHCRQLSEHRFQSSERHQGCICVHVALIIIQDDAKTAALYTYNCCGDVGINTCLGAKLIQKIRYIGVYRALRKWLIRPEDSYCLSVLINSRVQPVYALLMYKERQ